MSSEAPPKDGELLEQAVHALCRQLKMPGLSRALDELVRDLDGSGVLDVLEAALSTEVRSREASAVQTRLREARFPGLSCSTTSTSPSTAASTRRG